MVGKARPCGRSTEEGGVGYYCGLHRTSSGTACGGRYLLCTACVSTDQLLSDSLIWVETRLFRVEELAPLISRQDLSWTTVHWQPASPHHRIGLWDLVRSGNFTSPPTGDGFVASLPR